MKQTHRLLTAVFAVVIPHQAFAQRALENAVAEASDAFGTTVGREVIGLYSNSSARGFSPSQAGNIRIEGLYFDQVQGLNARIARGSDVHVGISSQGFLFPAPTGVVDFHLRLPTAETVASALVGVASHDQVYTEVDAATSAVGNGVLSIGGGIGYQRNPNYQYAPDSEGWNAGAIAKWQPNDSLVVIPFWSLDGFNEFGERPVVYIGNVGFPRYRSYELPPQPWASYKMRGMDFGAVGRLRFGQDWILSTGVFHSSSRAPNDQLALLQNTNSAGEGDYAISATPARSNASTSGEIRLAKLIKTETLQNQFYLSVRGRDFSNEFGGGQTISYGRGSTVAVPQVAQPTFNFGPITRVNAHQLTPGVAYEGVWRDVGQISLGLQKTYYHRTTIFPNAPAASADTSPWLYNVAVAGYITPTLSAYGSYTRGFEQVGNAPFIAKNRDEAAPAQLTKQIDAGLKYQITKQLQFVGGVFEIDKPYFNLDSANFFRRVGSTTNRGAEFSLTGQPVERLTVVAGVTLIDPKVHYDPGGGTGAASSVAIGPIPSFFRANVQYRTAIEGLTVEGKVERTSKRFATVSGNQLPAVTTFDTGVRYTRKFFGQYFRARLQLYNLTNEYGVLPQASGQLSAIDGRRFEISLAADFQ